MPTIKTTGTGAELRIITKTVDGEVRVSCECCETGCCMYPAASAVSSDLPNNITLRNAGSLARIGTDYGNTTNGVILEGGVWARYIGGVRTTRACLIDEDGNLTPGDDVVEDQFAATFTLTATELGVPYTATVTRVSLCVWESASPVASLIYTDIFAFPLPTSGAWLASINGFTPPFVQMAKLTGEGIGTPIGNYLNFVQGSSFVWTMAVTA